MQVTVHDRWVASERRPGIREIIECSGPTDRLVTRFQLLGLGFDDDGIGRYRKRGLIHRVTAGVYLVGRPVLTQRELWRAGLLTAGPRSALETYSAAEIRGMLWERYGRATVTTRAPGRVRRVKTKVPMENGKPGVIMIRYSTVRTPTEIVHGIPATTVARTLIDLAGLRRAPFEPAWREAEFRRVLDVPDLERELRLTRRKGARRVRRKLADYAPLPDNAELRTRLEVAFFRIFDAVGLPRPETNVPVKLNGEDYVPDFLDRGLGLAIEVDGPHHLLPSVVRRDKARDVDFFIAGLDVVRFTDDDAYQRPNATGDRLVAVYARQRARVAIAA